MRCCSQWPGRCGSKKFGKHCCVLIGSTTISVGCGMRQKWHSSDPTSSPSTVATVLPKFTFYFACRCRNDDLNWHVSWCKECLENDDVDMTEFVLKLEYVWRTRTMFSIVSLSQHFKHHCQPVYLHPVPQSQDTNGFRSILHLSRMLMILFALINGLPYLWSASCRFLDTSLNQRNPVITLLLQRTLFHRISFYRTFKYNLWIFASIVIVFSADIFKATLWFVGSLESLSTKLIIILNIHRQ